MKVVLVNPPMNFDIALGKAKNVGKYTVMIPHGLASIAAVLRENGIECIIIDAYAENLTIDSIIKRIKQYKPVAVGMTGVTPVIPIAHEIAKSIKEVDKSIKIILGGPHPSTLPKETLGDSNIDFIVRGEGEYAFLNLLHTIESNSDVSKVDGVSYRCDGRVIDNKLPKYIRDLDTLPMPSYELLPMDLYTAPPQWSIASPSFQLVASRGCPYSCSFCCVGMGKQVRYKSGRKVCDEIEYLVERYNCKQIVFVDTTFPFSTKHCEDVCSEIIRRKLHKKIVWFTSTRVDIVNQKMLDMMYTSGCRLITYGIESGNQHILDMAHKNITLEQAREAVKMAHKAKINITASYVFGLPGETPDTINDTINFAKELGTFYAQFNVIVPYPGTEVYNYAEKNGLLRNRDWNNYVSITSMTNLEPPFIAEGLTKEELLSLQQKAYNNFYLRPSIILRHMKKIVINREFKKYFTLSKILFKTFK